MQLVNPSLVVCAFFIFLAGCGSQPFGSDSNLLVANEVASVTSEGEGLCIRKDSSTPSSGYASVLDSKAKYSAKECEKQGASGNSGASNDSGDDCVCDSDSTETKTGCAKTHESGCENEDDSDDSKSSSDSVKEVECDD
jgi:hypothetical protein